MNTIPEVDLYLRDGCGRCSKYQTAQCKVHNWEEELVKLRTLLLDCGLMEELKWRQPCYTFQGRIILIMTAFKEFASLNFIKGVLLRDEDGLLVSAGENSQSARQLRFTDARKIDELQTVIKAYIHEAIEVEKAGLKPKLKKLSEYPVPEELEAKLKEDPSFREAFHALTPGRQRSYLLHIAAAKQASTRVARVERCMPQIFNGKGFNER